MPKKREENDPVRFITADGKVVEVDRKHLPNSSGKKMASNQELKNWMDNEKKGI